MDETGKKVPKLSWFGISRYLWDLFLVSDDMVEWVNEPHVRNTSYALCLSFFFLVVIYLVINPILKNFLLESSSLTMCWRIFMLVLWIWMLFLLSLLVYVYYVFLLSVNRDLKFMDIVFFFTLGMFFFAFLYKCIYFLNADLFVVPETLSKPKEIITELGYIKGIQLFLDFLMYSACTSLTLDYPRITSSSLIVSFVNVIQVIWNLLLIVLLIGTFVQRKVKVD